MENSGMRLKAFLDTLYFHVNNVFALIRSIDDNF